jgi:ubiquinone/menaquinone biosynthesis C-methylase UbiE
MPNVAPATPNGQQASRPEAAYILGHSELELRRLMVQARILRPITERMLRDAGIGAGMRVLDFGSGAGDVAMLAAELVGPRGSVTGIDRSAEAVDLAQERARKAGHHNVEFLQADERTLEDNEPFDAAIGRYVLLHQQDPAHFIRTAAAYVRPGGVIAFHEIGIFGDPLTYPPIPLYHEMWRRIVAVFASLTAHPDAGARMIMHFQDAGLPQPKVTCEIINDGGPDSPVYEWLALGVHTLLPQMEKLGIATASDIDIDTLEDRLRNIAVTERAQVALGMQYCGWVKRQSDLSH